MTVQVAPSGGSTIGVLPAGWYVVQTTTGFVGLVLHHQSDQAIDLGSSKYGAVNSAQLVGDATTPIYNLLGQADAAGRNAVHDALVNLGANNSQVTSFMTEADTAAGKQQGHMEGGVIGFLTGLVGATPFIAGKQTTQLLFDTNGNPTASSGTTPVSTTPSGDVQSAGASITAPSLLSLFGNLSLWKGVGLVLAGAAILVFAALELRKL